MPFTEKAILQTLDNDYRHEGNSSTITNKIQTEGLYRQMKSFLFALTAFICSVHAEDFLRGASVHTSELRELQSLGKILHFRLVDASSNSIGNNIIIEKIVNGTIIDFSKYSSNQAFNVEAVTNGTIGSMQFKYNKNAPFRPEMLKPYSLCGDVSGVFKPCFELNMNGIHSVTATPWSGTRGNGTMGKPVNVFFQITNGISPPTPPRPAPIPVRPVPVSVPVRPLPVPTPVRPVPVPIKPPVPGPSAGQWIEVNRNATEIIPRHEACFVMVGRKAYLLGGRYREDNAVDIYDPVSRTWSKGKAPPMELHHTQCVVVDGRIWIASSWTGSFPREKNTEFIFVSIFQNHRPP
jgi:Kelch motif